MASLKDDEERNKKMNNSLIHCPACRHRVSAAAASCVQCGHPIKSSGLRKRTIFSFMAVGLLSVIAVAGYKLDVHSNWLEVKADVAPAVVVQQTDSTLRMSERELALELQAFVLRANRTLPHKPNLMLTLERISYKPKPNRLTYDYELNAAAARSQIAFDLVRPALMNRYCHSDEFKVASVNEVEVKFRYLELGRVIHTEIIKGCDLTQVATR